VHVTPRERHVFEPHVTIDEDVSTPFEVHKEEDNKDVTNNSNNSIAVVEEVFSAKFDAC